MKNYFHLIVFSFSCNFSFYYFCFTYSKNILSHHWICFVQLLWIFYHEKSSLSWTPTLTHFIHKNLWISGMYFWTTPIFTPQITNYTIIKFIWTPEVPDQDRRTSRSEFTNMYRYVSVAMIHLQEKKQTKWVKPGPDNLIRNLRPPVFCLCICPCFCCISLFVSTMSFTLYPLHHRIFFSRRFPHQQKN